MGGGTILHKVGSARVRCFLTIELRGQKSWSIRIMSSSFSPNSSEDWCFLFWYAPYKEGHFACFSTFPPTSFLCVAATISSSAMPGIMFGLGHYGGCKMVDRLLLLLERQQQNKTWEVGFVVPWAIVTANGKPEELLEIPAPLQKIVRWFHSSFSVHKVENSHCYLCTALVIWKKFIKVYKTENFGGMVCFLPFCSLFYI